MAGYKLSRPINDRKISTKKLRNKIIADVPLEIIPNFRFSYVHGELFSAELQLVVFFNKMMFSRSFFFEINIPN